VIIDTHLHVIDKSVLGYPWLASVPALDRDFRYETYAAEARRVGISKALHMEVDVAEADIEAETAYVRQLSRRDNSLIAGAIASCRPEAEGFSEYLARNEIGGFVKGLRRVLHTMPDNHSEDPLFRANLKRLSGTGLTFDLVVLPRQVAKAIELVDLAPDVQFILDHCGVPDIMGDAHAPWAGNITEIARRPNVAAKVSGIVAYADPENWIVDSLRPYVEHVIGAFGWDRVVWGSDWPVCTLGGGLSTWVAATHALIAGCSEAERAALLGANAKRIWRLG
jgi:predicted TIM-barrel fold metal-dependent hydrolase